MRFSLVAGVAMLFAKGAAWWMTGSTAILSDALESVVHTAAVAFAAFSMALSTRPADDRFQYGYERISFFSAGFEGAMIMLAGITIVISAIYKWITGLELNQLGTGTLITATAGAANGALGWYLLYTGRKNKSLILEANGKHVLTDCWTSVGVVLGLCLVLITGWKPFDPICAILVGLNILWTGGELIWRSARGLLDYADPELLKELRVQLDRVTTREGLQYHELRVRETGGRLLAEVHLLFPFQTPVGEAHGVATRIEAELHSALKEPLEIVTHLEALEDHHEIHPQT